MRWVGEPSSGRLAPEPVSAPAGHVAAPDPPSGMLVLPRGRSGWTQEVPDPYGGSEASAVSSELPFLRDTWRLQTHPQAGNGSGAVGLVRKGPDPWGLAALFFARSYG